MPLLHIEAITYVDHVVYVFNGQHHLFTRFNDVFVFKHKVKRAEWNITYKVANLRHALSQWNG